jgi:molecular chaperone GrpE
MRNRRQEAPPEELHIDARQNAEDEQAPSMGREDTESVSGDDEVAALTAERDSYLDQLQRTMADFANYRKRVDQERQLARQLATRDFLQTLVPIIDDFERAMNSMPLEEKQSPWAQGVELIQRKLVGLLEREGVSKVESLGQPFDPSVHEAVATEPNNQDNIVVEVYQQGYQQGGHLLRPAMVKVGNLKPGA